MQLYIAKVTYIDMENKDSYPILDEVKLTADSDAITGKMIINAIAGDPDQ